MPETRESIGSLSTIVQRKTFTIESRKNPRGKIYDVSDPSDFGPFEYAMLIEKQRLAQELQKKTRLTVKEKTRMREALDDVMRLLIPKVEPAVLGEMSEQQKANFVLTWILATSPTEVTPGNRQARRRTARKTTSRRPTGSR